MLCYPEVMGSKRKWYQEVDRSGLLTLTDMNDWTTKYVHRFSPRLFKEVAQMTWSQHQAGYAQARPDSVRTYLHWLAAGVGGGRGKSVRALHVEHINGDPFDSRDENVKVVPKRINDHSPSYKGRSPEGVGIRKQKGGYQVAIAWNRTYIYQPYFLSHALAVKCRDKFVAIALASDRGDRPIPTRDELKAVADTVRKEAV